MDVVIWLLAGSGLVGLVGVLRHRTRAEFRLPPRTARPTAAPEQVRWVARSRWDVDGGS